MGYSSTFKGKAQKPSSGVPKKPVIKPPSTLTASIVKKIVERNKSTEALIAALRKSGYIK